MSAFSVCLCVFVKPVSLNVLGETFVWLISFPFSYQSSYPVWEDFSAKATKLHSQLRWEAAPLNGRNLDERKSCVIFTDFLCSHSAVNMCQYIYRTTILAAVAFLDAFQKVADMATNSRGKGMFLCEYKLSHSGVKTLKVVVGKSRKITFWTDWFVFTECCTLFVLLYIFTPWCNCIMAWLHYCNVLYCAV